MRPDKIYFPVDGADVYRVPPPPRPLPPLLEQSAQTEIASARIFLVLCAAAALVGAALLPGWWRISAVLPAILAIGAVARLRVARSRRTVWCDGEVVLARVCFLVGGIKTEIRYVEKEREVTTSGDIGVFAGDPGARAVVEYEFDGRVRAAQIDLGVTGKPLAVRIGEKLGCAVIVHASRPDAGILVTSRLIRSALAS